MGEVFRARDPRSGREVALKLVPLSGGAEETLRFQREAEVVAQLNHPGIVTVHGAGIEGSTAWLACELVEGARPLDEAAAPLPLPERVALLAQAADALAFAHQRGIVHRDVKPENLLVDPAGRVRVIDFGLARPQDAQSLTATGALLGTPYAMAPEQAYGEGISPATDVWALGVTLYILLTGQRPFTATATLQLLSQISQEDPTPPRSLAKEVSPALDALTLRALARDPRGRPPDAAAFAAELRAALSDPGRTPRWPALALASALLLLAGAGIALASASRRASASPSAIPSVAQALPSPSTSPPPAELTPGSVLTKQERSALAERAARASALIAQGSTANLAQAEQLLAGVEVDLARAPLSPPWRAALLELASKLGYGEGARGVELEPAALIGLGHAIRSEREGEPRLAEACFRWFRVYAETSQPRDLEEALLELARSLRRSGRSSEAVQVYEEAIALPARPPAPPWELAQYERELQRAAREPALVEEAVRRGNAEALARWGELLFPVAKDELVDDMGPAELIASPAEGRLRGALETLAAWRARDPLAWAKGPAPILDQALRGIQFLQAGRSREARQAILRGLDQEQAARHLVWRRAVQRLAASMEHDPINLCVLEQHEQPEIWHDVGQAAWRSGEPYLATALLSIAKRLHEEGLRNRFIGMTCVVLARTLINKVDPPDLARGLRVLDYGLAQELNAQRRAQLLYLRCLARSRQGAAHPELVADLDLSAGAGHPWAMLLDARLRLEVRPEEDAAARANLQRAKERALASREIFLSRRGGKRQWQEAQGPETLSEILRRLSERGEPDGQ